MSKFLICECCNQTYLEEDMSKNNKNMCCSCWCYTRPKDKRIAELEEQLKNSVRLKFKIGQEIWEITQLMSWKIKRIELHKFNGGNGDVVMEIYRLGHDGTDDYNCCIMPVDNDRFFATKEEALAKLEELRG